MPKDYARKSSNKANPESKHKHLLARLIALLVIVLIIAGLFWLMTKDHPDLTKRTTTSNQHTASAKIVDATPVKRLAEQALASVQSPTQPSSAIDFKFNQQTVTAPKHPYFMLQLASSTEIAPANALKKRLKTLGYKAIIRQHIKGNEVIYRVQLGHFKTQARARQAQETLQKHNIAALILSI
ncbi:MAG: SPOR domain-containing protein [Pseudomonadota bacterium]